MDISKVRQSTILDKEEKEHLEVVCEIINAVSKMREPGDFFDTFNINHLIVDVSVLEEYIEPDTKCLIESYSAWDANNELLVIHGAHNQIIKILEIFGDLYYRYISEPNNVASLSVILSTDENYKEEIIECLVSEQLTTKLKASDLHLELNDTKKEVKKNKI